MLLHFFHFFFHPPFPLLFKRHDLPTDRNETGIMFTKPMTDVRAFHVFSRGSALVPYLELKSTAPIACPGMYNAITAMAGGIADAKVNNLANALL